MVLNEPGFDMTANAICHGRVIGRINVAGTAAVEQADIKVGHMASGSGASVKNSVTGLAVKLWLRPVTECTVRVIVETLKSICFGDKKGENC
jgi:hypothetical protein